MTGGVVGRAFERASLEALLDGASSGRGAGAILLGDAGIGKTTLATSLASVATARGFQVGWGRCPDSETIPLWPWRQALQGMGSDGNFTDLVTTSRAALFARVVDGMLDRDRSAPALIIVEDVHFADEASCALLEFFVGALPELPCALLLTSRDNTIDLTGPAAETVQRLPPAISRLSLGGLDRASSAAILAGVLGPVDATTIDELHVRSGGNPFFLQELARLLASRGAAPLGTPAGVGQVLGRRLARLSQRTYECLAAGAVLGEDGDIQVLAGMLDQPVADVLDLLGDAVDARLGVVDGRRFHFAHALVREVLLDGLSPIQRSTLHMRAGQALTGTCCNRGRHAPRYGLPLAPCCSAERVQASAAQVAEHFRHAVGVSGSAELAREHALSAARVAVRRSGYEQAARFYEWALDGIDSPAVRVEYGETLMLAGQMNEGRDVLRRVAHDALAIDDGELAARAVLAMGGAGGFEVDLFDTDQTALLDAAFALLPEGDSAVKAATLARLGLARAHGRLDAESRTTTRAAIDMAHRVGDARTEASAIAAWCDTASGPEFVTERRHEAQRMLSMAERCGEPTLALLARRLLIMALLESGEFPTADAQIAAYAQAADRLRLAYYAWYVPVWSGMRALMNGDLEETDRHLHDAAAIAERAGSDNVALMVATLRFARADLTDTMSEVMPLIESVFGPLLDVPMAQCYLSYYLVRAGETDRARRYIEQRLAAGLDFMAHDAEWLTSVALLGEAARQLDLRPAVQASLQAIEPFTGLWLHDGIGAGCYGSVTDYVSRFRSYLGHTARPSPTTTGHRAGEFHRTGSHWSVRWQGELATVADSKGMRDLATLLAQPHTSVHVLDLAGSPPALGGGSIGPVLDDRVRAEYRSRLSELEHDIGEAEDFADLGRLEKLTAEPDFLARELAAALGLGGRARNAGDPVERARKAVSMRITAAIKSIETVDPALGRHLKASVRTGRHCVYEPETDTAWTL